MPASGKAYITRSAVFLPNTPVANDEIENVLGMIAGKPSRARRIVLRNNGIRQRYYAIDPASGQSTHSNAQLTAQAVRGLDLPASIDCLVCGTTTPDQLMPGHGVMVHGELGLPACEVISTAGICVAGITALKYAYLNILSGQAKAVVAAASEQVSSLIHARNFEAESELRINDLENSPEIAFEKDFLRWMLSDGAGAFLLEPQPAATGLSLRIDWIEIVSQAGHMEVCMYAGGEKQPDGSLKGWKAFSSDAWARRSVFSIKQDVRLLNENVVEQTLAKPLQRVMSKYGLQADDLDWFLPHMSSEYFRQPMTDCMKRLGFPVAPEKWFTNLHSMGNTGSASIYLMIDELLKSGQLATGQRLLCFIPESGRFTGALMHLTVSDHAGK